MSEAVPEVDGLVMMKQKQRNAETMKKEKREKSVKGERHKEEREMDKRLRDIERVCRTRVKRKKHNTVSM